MRSLGGAGGWGGVGDLGMVGNGGVGSRKDLRGREVIVGQV